RRLRSVFAGRGGHWPTFDCEHAALTRPDPLFASRLLRLHARGIVRASKGFTLIELLVVLAIMALVVTLLTPMLRIGRSGADLRSASSEMLAAMRTARSAAIAQNRTAAVVLDPVDGRYGEPRRYHLLPKGMNMSWHALWPVAGHDEL